MARTLYRSLTERLLTLPDHLVLYPAHYSGSVCGRGLSANPISTIGFERRHNPRSQFDSEDAFVEALTRHPAGARAAGRDRRRQPQPAGRSPVAGVTRRGPARAAREPRAVLAAGRGQRLRRRDGRPRALDAAADRPRRLRPRLERRGALVHRRLRLAKALTNLGAGALAERAGAAGLLIAGWAIALPVPLLIAVAPSWGWIVAANVLLGVNQGLAWSMTVVMKIDLVGPERRGLALGLNEAAGYGGVALAAGSAAGSPPSSPPATSSSSPAPRSRVARC